MKIWTSQTGFVSSFFAFCRWTFLLWTLTIIFFFYHLFDYCEVTLEIALNIILNSSFDSTDLELDQLIFVIRCSVCSVRSKVHTLSNSMSIEISKHDFLVAVLLFDVSYKAIYNAAVLRKDLRHNQLLRSHNYTVEIGEPPILNVQIASNFILFVFPLMRTFSNNFFSLFFFFLHKKQLHQYQLVRGIHRHLNNVYWTKSIKFGHC